MLFLLLIRYAAETKRLEVGPLSNYASAIKLGKVLFLFSFFLDFNSHYGCFTPRRHSI